MSINGNSDTGTGRNRGSRRWRLLVLSASLVLGGAGCYRAAYRTDKPPNGQVHTQWNHFFFWGAVNTAEVDVPAVCEHGMSELIIRKTVANWFVGALTLGLYSPLTAIVHCAAAAPLAPPERPDAPPTTPPGATPPAPPATPAAPPTQPATVPPAPGGGTP